MTAKLTTLPRIEGEARVEGAKRLKIEGEARTESEAREARKNGGRGLGRELGEPLLREFFEKIELETIHFGAYLRQTFEINNNMHGSRTCSIAHIHEQIDIEYLISGNCLILLKN